MSSWLRPLPRAVTRPISLLIVVAWIGVMAVLVHRSYARGAGNLATDLARYGSAAQWRGVYYRGEKLGFTVSQTVPAGGDGADGGFELQEDGQLQMSLLGAHTFTRLRTTARPIRTARPGWSVPGAAARRLRSSGSVGVNVSGRSPRSDGA